MEDASRVVPCAPDVAGRSCLQPIKSGLSVRCASRLLYPRKRTLIRGPWTSAKGRLQTYEAADNRHFGIGSFWTAIKRSSVRKTLLFSVLFVRHLRALTQLLLARQGSNLRWLVKTRPEIIGIVLKPYVAANWDAKTRIARIADHYRTVGEIGGVVDFPSDILIDVIQLTPIDLRYRITLDQARWLLPEGPLVISLWDGVDRIFHLGFCLSTENGRRVAYIGSIQGRAERDIYDYKIDILNRYRRFTRAASGMRPRDFLVEVFKIFCKAINVSEIRAVSNLNHPQRKLFDVKLSYDEIWTERGGSRTADGFFILPVAASRRTEEEIPAKKRAMYAKRYAMLDIVEAEVTATVRSSLDRSSAVFAEA